MIVVDTMVLIYAVTDAGRLSEASGRLLNKIASRQIQASTTIEVLQEFAHVYARRRSRATAASLTREYGALLAPLLICESDHLDEGMNLFANHVSLGAFDSVLAATALAYGAEALISADAGFRSIEGLQVLEPGTPEFDQMIGPA